MSSSSPKKKRTVSEAGLDAPCCWLCLEEGPDESGAPLVRNCSCRGLSGFAHLSCLQKYAESEGRRAYDRAIIDPSDVAKAFITCPNW